MAAGDAEPGLGIELPPLALALLESRVLPRHARPLPRLSKLRAAGPGCQSAVITVVFAFGMILADVSRGV